LSMEEIEMPVITHTDQDRVTLTEDVKAIITTTGLEITTGTLELETLTTKVFLEIDPSTKKRSKVLSKRNLICSMVLMINMQSGLKRLRSNNQK